MENLHLLNGVLCEDLVRELRQMLNDNPIAKVVKDYQKYIHRIYSDQATFAELALFDIGNRESDDETYLHCPRWSNIAEKNNLKRMWREIHGIYMSFGRQLSRGFKQFGRQLSSGANVFGRQLSNTAPQ
eukprot:54415-Eustigmatos_ZCMA.PRE.1